jgi:hypothetical protein
MEDGFRKQDEILSRLERLSLISEELYKRSAMENINSLGEESTDLAEKLGNFLSSKPTASQIKELRKLAGRIANLMKEIADTIRNMPKNLPEEFVNSDSVKKIDFNKTMDLVSEVNSALSSGDVNSALERARQLLKALEEMKKKLKNAYDEVPPMAEFPKEKDRTLEEIISQQRMIYSETKSVLSDFNELLKKNRKEKAKILDTKIKEISRRTAEMWNQRRKFFGKNTGKVYRRLYEVYKNARVSERRFLERGFNWQAPLEKSKRDLAGITDFSASTRTVAEIMKIEKDIQDFFEIYKSSPDVEMSDENKNFLVKISTQQLRTAAKTDDFAKKLSGLWRKSAQFPDEIISDVKNALGEMENSAEELAMFDPKGASLAQEKALYYLEKASRNMESMAFSSSAGGPSRRIPKFMPSSRGSSVGSMGFDERSFEIPSGKFFRFDALLEQINRAKGTAQPEKYRELLENYYNELSK